MGVVSANVDGEVRNNVIMVTFKFKEFCLKFLKDKNFENKDKENKNLEEKLLVLFLEDELSKRELETKDLEKRIEYLERKLGITNNHDDCDREKLSQQFQLTIDKQLEELIEETHASMGNIN